VSSSRADARIGKAAVMAHTGGVAGSEEACDAALRPPAPSKFMSIDDLIVNDIARVEMTLRPDDAKSRRSLDLRGESRSLWMRRKTLDSLSRRDRRHRR